MGSSHYAGLPTWRQLIALGHNAWAIDTGQLLDNDTVLDAGTLLIITSQSGASGEVTELLERRQAGRVAPAALVGVADNESSPLARAADLFIPLHSGPEATVSTKSYLNTLAVHRLIRATFTGRDLGAIRAVRVRRRRRRGPGRHRRPRPGQRPRSPRPSTPPAGSPTSGPGTAPAPPCSRP